MTKPFISNLNVNTPNLIGWSKYLKSQREKAKNNFFLKFFSFRTSFFHEELAESMKLARRR